MISKIDQLYMEARVEADTATEHLNQCEYGEQSKHFNVTLSQCDCSCYSRTFHRAAFRSGFNAALEQLPEAVRETIKKDYH